MTTPANEALASTARCRHRDGSETPDCVGHLRLDAAAFEAWEPEFLPHTTLPPEDLEGYRMWREAEDGGVWGRTEGGDTPGFLARVMRLFVRG